MKKQKKYIITGMSGFVGRHFLEYLEKNNIESDILGIDIYMPGFDISSYKSVNYSFKKIDLLNKEILAEVVGLFKPDYILHLASYSSVSFSWHNPIISFKNNTNIFLNLLEAVKIANVNCRILSIGSSEEYGEFNEISLPLKEDCKLNPTSPYAVARVTQELLSKVYVKGYGLDIVMTRSFNHIGPGQKDIFVVSSFAKQLVQIKKRSLNNGILRVGNLDVVRDFLDVREVVDAYFKLLESGRSGDVYNVCSGKGISLRDIINILKNILELEVGLKIDESLIRPADIEIVVGCNDKIKNEIGWENKISIEKSLNDIISYWTKESIEP